MPSKKPDTNRAFSLHSNYVNANNMVNNLILNCVKSHGQIIDRQIAAELSISMDTVKAAIDDLTKSRELYTCNITHFKNGIEISGILCRLSGYMPPASSGRKPKA